MSQISSKKTFIRLILLEYGFVGLGGFYLLKNLLQLTYEPHSRWKLYYIWKIISSAAALYGYNKRDAGHIKWFMYMLLLDIVVYIVQLQLDPEFSMDDQGSCRFVVRTNPKMTMDECMRGIREIRMIAYFIHGITIVWKTYCTLVAKRYLNAVQGESGAAIRASRDVGARRRDNTQGKMREE